MPTEKKHKIETPVVETPVVETVIETPVVETPVVEKAEYSGNYIMKVTHLSWGKSGKNHFFADDKPTINAKVMAEYADILKVWLANKWVEKGSY
jgi:hypothetical protein